MFSLTKQHNINRPANIRQLAWLRFVAFVWGLCLSLILPLGPLLAQVTPPQKPDSTTRQVTKEETLVETKGLTTVQGRDALNTNVMKEGELFKAACCNLSESFETNPSIDVNYTDALTGARQIQLLGLSGLYAQLMTENRPDARGLFANYGLSYTPGTWVESIQVTKGTGSVVNGYESISGLINIENKKPEGEELVYLNAYANHLGRFEANAVGTARLTPNLSTAIYLHTDQWANKFDMNNDGFMDMPMSRGNSFMNRWKYDGDAWKAQFGAQYLVETRNGGQLHADETGVPHHGNTALTYETNQNTTHWNAFAKVAKVFHGTPYRSLGLIAQVTGHNQDGLFGMRSFSAFQRSAYANFIYQDIIGTTDHKYRTGLSIQTDDMREWQTGLSPDTINFQRTEIVPGAFYEHTWSPNPSLTLIGGLRADYNNLFGAFLTPRLHGRYAINEKNTLRFSAGRGQRTANPMTDNGAALGSNRILMSQGQTRVNGYNLRPEVAYNYGLSLSHDFELLDGNGTLVLDAYRTDFVNQVVVDLENPRLVQLYNLQGQSFSNSLQAEANYRPNRRWDVRLAYRWLDVQTSYQTGLQNQLLSRPLIATHRAFVNIAYTTRNKWAFDLTATFTGQKRLPSTTANLPQDQLPSHSPAFLTGNAQITKTFAGGLDLYIGAENLADFRQQQLLIAPDRPFGPNFDASMVWGPVTGRVFYVGFRYKLIRPSASESD